MFNTDQADAFKERFRSVTTQYVEHFSSWDDIVSNVNDPIQVGNAIDAAIVCELSGHLVQSSYLLALAQLLHDLRQAML